MTDWQSCPSNPVIYSDLLGLQKSALLRPEIVVEVY